MRRGDCGSGCRVGSYVEKTEAFQEEQGGRRVVESRFALEGGLVLIKLGA